VQHFDQRRQYEKALSFIDQAISHSPTVIDLWLVKVLILDSLETFLDVMLLLYGFSLCYSCINRRLLKYS